MKLSFLALKRQTWQPIILSVFLKYNQIIVSKLEIGKSNLNQYSFAENGTSSVDEQSILMTTKQPERGMKNYSMIFSSLILCIFVASNLLLLFLSC